MNTRILAAVLTICGAMLLGATTCAAAGEGQEDLDQATRRKVTAGSLSDLEDVIQLCEQALEKGLDKENEKFAKQLVTATLFQRASGLSRAILDRPTPDRRWPQLRKAALKDLEAALKFDTELGYVHLLIARLQALPGGDRKRAVTAVNEAIRGSAGNEQQQQLAAAHKLRAELVEDPQKRLADLSKAVELDPKDWDLLRRRGMEYLTQNKYEPALEDLKKVTSERPEDVAAHHGCAEALTFLKKYDEAREHLDKVLKTDEGNVIGLLMRSRLSILAKDNDAALDDLGKAIRINPRNVTALLMRAELLNAEDKWDKAGDDVDRVLRLRPKLKIALRLRVAIYSRQRKYHLAIQTLEKLLEEDPKNIAIRLQKAAFHAADQRPRKAIELYTTILKESADNWLALSGRANAFLSIGEHRKAIADFQAGLKLQPGNSNMLNNLAWVLATSPQDDLRDGSRSIEFAKKACEATEYKTAHILSTLGAAYAEKGDFETAIKWSSKAVELGEGESKEQLNKELESYKKKKPWREIQQIKEKPEPEKPGVGDLDLSS